VTAVVHADDPNVPEGLVYGFSATFQWSCLTGYPLGQAIALFNMGSPTGKAMLMPGNASTMLVAHWGAGAFARLTPPTSAFVALVPGVRSCPRFLKATATEVYLVTVEGTVGTASEPCNTNRGLHRVRLSDNTVTGFVPFGTKPRDPVISADGSTIYVPDYAENQIYVVDAGSMTVTRTIAVPGGPVAAVLTADGTHLIVARWDVGDIALINTTTGAGVGAIASGGVHPTALLLGENNVVVVLNYGDPDTETNGAIATFRYTIP
jgi:YVTN family beta-propeller protein